MASTPPSLSGIDLAEAGELAAQALYHGQALVARSESTRAMLLSAARSESDHLAWCVIDAVAQMDLSA